MRIHEGPGPVPSETMLNEIVDVEGLLCTVVQKVDAEVIRRAKKLKIVSNMAIDYFNIDVEAATKAGIMVTHAPVSLTETVADAAVGLMLAVARRIPEADRYVRTGGWAVGWRPLALAGREVHGKTLGIYGLGRIGAAVASRGRGFGMKVIYYDVVRKRELEEASGFEYRSLDGLLKESDFLSINVATLPEDVEERYGSHPSNFDELLRSYLGQHKDLRWVDTRGSIGARELSMMKKTAFIINTARGQVVDQKALLKALKEKWIAGAGLDVFDSEPIDTKDELLKLENVVFTPHVGGATIESRTEMAVMAANDLITGLGGQSPPNLVNAELLGRIR